MIHYRQIPRNPTLKVKDN